MLNTSTWPELDLNVLDQIHLDSTNVRLADADNKIEADILADLFSNEGALGLVEAISKVGYLTHEIPIVIKPNKKYVVVEGNRRIAALKAIQNPLLVPAFQARIKALTKGAPHLKTLTSVRVKVAPNEDAASQLVAAIHTGNLRRPWSPARQAAFFQAQINNGRTYNELLRRYPTNDVHGLVFRGHVINLFEGVAYDSPDLLDFVKSRTWRRSLSTLERIYETKDFTALTGIAMDDQGVFTTTMTAPQLKAVATVIVEGIYAKDLTTRSINKVSYPRFTRLLADISGALKIGSTSPKAKVPTKSAATSANPPKPKTKQTHLVLSQLGPLDHLPIALLRQLEELTITNVQKMPNTTFLELRAILEKSIKAFAEAKGEEIRKTANDKGFVQLKHSLIWFQAHLQAHGPKELLQPVQKVTTGVRFGVSKPALDAVNHNHKYVVDPDEVFHMWDSIEPLLRELLKP